MSPIRSIRSTTYDIRHTVPVVWRMVQRWCGAVWCQEGRQAGGLRQLLSINRTRCTTAQAGVIGPIRSVCLCACVRERERETDRESESERLCARACAVRARPPVVADRRRRDEPGSDGDAQQPLGILVPKDALGAQLSRDHHDGVALAGGWFERVV
jgi:hypothetical protein